MDEQTILYVDDNKVNLNIIQRMLQRRGYNCIVTNEAKNTLSLVNQHQPDLIFLDIHMPEINGYDVLKQVKSTSMGQKLPIIALTANASAHERHACHIAGFTDFVAKPINRQELKHIIDKHLMNSENS